MEVVAATSSITAIIQFSAIIVRATTDLIHSYKEVPAELEHVAHQLRYLHSELTLIENLREEGGDSLALLPEEIREFFGVLELTQALILEFKSSCTKYKHDEKVSKSLRWKWVFQDQAKIKSMSARLRQAQSSLNNILQLANIRIANLARKHIELHSTLSKTSFTILLKDVDTIRKIVERDTQQGRIPENMVLNGLVTRNPHERNKFWKSFVRLEESWLNYLTGIRAGFSCYGNDYQTTFDISATYRLFGYKMVVTHLRVRRFPLAGSGLNYVLGETRVKNVVSENSKIMIACKMGDLDMVRRLFVGREASPFDVTPQNSTPLRYAIESGNKDLVDLLLTSGAGADAPFGEYITSPLEWAFASRQYYIARLLIERGARTDHINAKGWTPVHNLFGYEWIHHTSGRSIREYLELLSARGFSEYDIKDRGGWTAIHGAAAYGTADDIAALMERGSSLSESIEGFGKPIKFAVRLENADTFLELLKYQQSSSINDQDARGWTLLHEAAQMGSTIMLDLLLQHGADPHIVSEVVRASDHWWVPEGLEGRAVTAAELAMNEGPENYEIFVRALKKAGFDLTVREDLDDDDMRCIFWGASSGQEDEKQYQRLVDVS